MTVLIACNSVFDEDITIPPARHIQLIGVGPWVLGNSNLANFGSSTPRNVTIQSNQAMETFYSSQGVQYVARPVTVIGTLNNGTSISTHTNYANGAIISGNIIFQNTDPVDPFSTLEFQLLNARVFGTVQRDAVNPQQGQLNTYIYHCRINSINHPVMNLQRMMDSVVDGLLSARGYSEVANSNFAGNVTFTNVIADVPPLGVFSSTFGSNITWNGDIRLDAASNYYFVNNSVVLIGTKTLLHSLA